MIYMHFTHIKVGFDVGFHGGFFHLFFPNRAAARPASPAARSRRLFRRYAARNARNVPASRYVTILQCGSDPSTAATHPRVKNSFKFKADRPMAPPPATVVA